MKALDITPRYIGRYLRITDDHTVTQGFLQGLEVETVEDTPVFANQPHYMAGAIIVHINGTEHYLDGSEDVTIVGKVQR